MPALDWITSDQVALKVVESFATSNGETAEGVIDADTEVTGEEVTDAETAAKAIGTPAVETTSCAGRENIKLEFASAEQIVLHWSDDDFLGISDCCACERGRGSRQNDCEECKSFIHVVCGLWFVWLILTRVSMPECKDYVNGKITVPNIRYGPRYREFTCEPALSSNCSNLNGFSMIKSTLAETVIHA